MAEFSKIVIWGYKPPMKHTHHPIHLGYYKAFKKLGFDTLWLDDTDDVSAMNFDNCLFFTEGQVDKKIPLNNKSKYILHFCDGAKYSQIDSQNKVALEYFHKNVLSYGATKINEYTYVGKDVIYQPWATDLLPDEIDENEAHNELNKKECIWIGSYSPNDKTEYENNTELDPFFNEAKKCGVTIKTINPWSVPVSFEANRTMIHDAYLAPSINGKFQKRIFYVPCRIFKNISYGHLGITNNSFVNDMFGGQLIYDSDPAGLLYKSIDKKNDPKIIPYIQSLMKEVKEKHTYINRVNVLLDFFK